MFYNKMSNVALTTSLNVNMIFSKHVKVNLQVTHYKREFWKRKPNVSYAIAEIINQYDAPINRNPIILTLVNIHQWVKFEDRFKIGI